MICLPSPPAVTFVVLKRLWFLPFALAVLFSSVCAQAALQPYSADVNTLHLWHFDESAPPFTDSLAGGTNLTYLTGGASAGIEGPAIPFSNSLNFGTLDTSNAVLFPAGSGNAGTPVPFAFAGSDGAFTFEALVQIGFNPTNFVRNQPCQILNGDANNAGGGSRVFQLRLLPVGFIGGGGDTNFVRIEFINGATTVAIAPIPTNGPDAIASNNWYHIAVTYNGSPNTASNLLFYWTLVDSSRPAANLIYSATMASALPGVSSATTIFSVGNSARNPGGGAGPAVANFLGNIDEVRISSVARAANEFVFQNISVTASSYQSGTANYPTNTLDGNLATRWSAEGDGQYLTYDLGRIELVQSIDLAFYQPSGVRSNWFDVLLSNDGVAWRNTLTNAVGTNAALANFAFTAWPARYVRVVGHLNSQNDFNSITEAAIHYSTPVDADNDGLPDVWELYYFGNLTDTPADDPDGDSQPNAYELLHGTDPTVPNVSGDSDNDGLPDAWEMANFGTLSFGANDDPDRDGFSNLQEYLAGSNPMDANSIPSDINGNNLPDAWETNAVGGFVASAYDDADGDGYNNLAEMIWGTNPTNAASHPSFVSPRVALLNDSIIATNACLMPLGSTYGRAINGISFQTRILANFDGYEYTAWYDSTGSGSTTTQTVWLARRTVTNTAAGAWEKFNTGSTFVNGKAGWDAHDVISLGISPIDGTLHFAWDMHGNTLRYRHSVLGLCTTNKSAWGNAGMMNPEQNWLVNASSPVLNVTYPMFINNPSGALIFEYRIGSTSAGDHYLNTYIPGGNWTAGIKFSAKEGAYTGMLATGSIGSSTSRNAYENNFDFSPGGVLHHTWTYREAADAANHDLDYAYSPDNGVTWFNNGGTNIADTTLGQSINVNSPGIIFKVLDSRQRLINQQAQCVDNDGRVHVLALHRRAEPDAAWVSGDSVFSVLDTAYFHYFRDPVTHMWSQRRIPWTVFPVGSRPKLGYDAQGNLYGVYLSYASTNTDVTPGYANGRLVIATASKASQYTDWQVVCALPNDLNGEPLIDQTRLLAGNILSVFIQENSAAAGVVGTPLHVFDFAVNIAPANTNSVSLNFLGTDAAVAFNSSAGHTYQLQVAPSLTSPAWTNIGSILSGIDGMMALADPNARQSPQRFYRVIADP